MGKGKGVRVADTAPAQIQLIHVYLALTPFNRSNGAISNLHGCHISFIKVVAEDEDGYLLSADKRGKRS